jgi:hypothetical protein
MSVLTEFFPAASGGGGGVTSNPNDLHKTYVHPNDLRFGSSTASSSPSFWTQAMPVFGTKGLTTNNLTLPSDSTAYATMIDVTNTGKGGTLQTVVGPSHYNPGNPSVPNDVTFKFTIDGTVTEIVSQGSTTVNSSVTQSRPILGALVPGGPTTTYGFPYYGNSPSIEWDKAFDYNGFRAISYGGISAHLPTTFNLLNRIVFTDTFKLEIKSTNTIYQSSEWNKCGLTITINP